MPAYILLLHSANDLMNPLQHTLQAIATATGMVAILAPVASVLLTSRHKGGRSTGRGASLQKAQ
jgi:hypothetical protein